MPAKRSDYSSASDGLKLLQSFESDVEKGRRFPVLLLTGTESYFIDKAKEIYLRAVVEPAFADFDVNEFRGSEVQASVLWDSLTTIPFGSSSRTVVIEDPKDMKKKEVLECVTRYLSRPSSTTSLILVQPLGDKRDRPPAWALKQAVVFDFAELNAASRAKWVKSYVEAQGKVIQDDAVSYLNETSATQLLDLKSKLDHAVLYSGEDSTVSLQTIMAVSGVTSGYTVFNLEDALLVGDRAQALTIARSLLLGGEALLMLLGWARNMTLRVWQIQYALGKPEENAVFTALLQSQIFKKQKYISCARRVGVVKIRERIQELLELERMIKRSSTDPQPQYYRWIWEFAA